MPSSIAHVSRSASDAILATTASQSFIDKKRFELAQRLAHVLDRDFLSEFSLSACELVGADIFMIGRLNPYSNLVRSVRMVCDGVLAEDAISYSLAGTPCERAAESGICVYRSGVANLFPQDKMLEDLGIEGYAGTALKSSAGELLGVLVALTRTPIIDDKLALGVLEEFHDRIAAALEMSETIERHDWVIAETTDGIWDWDLVTGGVTVSNNLQAALMGDARGAVDLSKIEEAIHPEDKSRHIEALRSHFQDDTPYDLKLRLRDRSGEYRWRHARGKAMRNAAGKPVRMIACLNDIHDLIVADSGE